MRKIGIAIALAVVVIISAIFVIRRSKHSNPETIRVSGNIEITSTALSFKVPGRVQARPVDEGETVKAGQVVARLDDADLANEVAQRRAQLENARQVLAELEAGSRKEEIGQAEAALSRAEAEAKQLSDDFQRQKALFDREVIPKQKLDAAKAAMDSSRAQVREAMETLTLVRKGPRRERIAQAQARLKENREALNEAQTRLGYATLSSPVAGLVTAKHIEPGEQVNAGTPVITVGDIGNTWLRAYIPETELGRVKVGQKARITTDTYPGRLYEGTVSFISPEAEFTPKNVQTEKERVKLVYRIKITLPNPRIELKPGMPADAEILAGTGDRGPGTGK